MNQENCNQCLFQSFAKIIVPKVLLLKKTFQSIENLFLRLHRT